MNLLVASPLWLVGVLIAFLTAAMIQDAVQLKISNALTFGVLALAVVAMAISGFPISLWQNFLLCALVLAAGTVLFSKGALGGGDVKLLAGVALWVDLKTSPFLLAAILMCGGVLAVAILILRTMVPDRVSRRVMVLRPKAGIPYAIAIAIGTLIVTGVYRAEAARAKLPGLTIPAVRIGDVS
jgi:prepilin peptidase CpaA